MRKKASHLDENDLTLEVAALPVTESKCETALPESETAVLPIIEAEVLPVIEVEAPSDEGDKDRQDIRILELKIAELEDKFITLQAELNTLVNKKKKKKERKGNKVKCKCKDKKVDLVKCKCTSKKSDE